jgi:hypothetical protein
MAISQERLSRQQTERMPRIGTAAHLRYLADLIIEPDEPWVDPKTFLAETMAATSLARMIFRHAADWPLANTLRASLDTRDPRFVSDEKLPLFRAAVDLPPPIDTRAKPATKQVDEYTPPWPIDHTIPRNLVIHCQPNPTYTYDLVIPIQRVNIYDPSRPLLASYRYKDGTAAVYNETASPPYCDVKTRFVTDYDQHNEFIFSSVVQQAAEDLLEVANHLRRRPSKSLPYKAVEVKWHDYDESDGADQLVEQRLRELREKGEVA